MNINGVYSGVGTTSPTDPLYDTAAMSPPAFSEVQAFNKGMMGDGAGDSLTKAGDCAAGNDGADGRESSQPGEQIEALLKKVLEQLLQLLSGLQDDGSQSRGEAEGGSAAADSGGVQPVEGSGTGGSAGSDELIPEPGEHIQQLNLGGKQVTVGGDGSASAAEVEATAASINNLYQNSPSFSNMIDNSSDPSFEVSVGRRDDNTSWGNSEGRVFMNINNVQPGDSDAFQSLLGHEFAHASIDLGHGTEMEQIESRVAQEA